MKSSADYVEHPRQGRDILDSAGTSVLLS